MTGFLCTGQSFRAGMVMDRPSNAKQDADQLLPGIIAIIDRCIYKAMDDLRQDKLQQWVGAQLGAGSPVALTTVSGDASFRRYFRARQDGQPFIAVDAPPEHEDNPRFTQVAKLFRDSGVLTPEIIAGDFESGFLLLEDFGDSLYLDSLLKAQAVNETAVPEQLYRQAIDALVNFQVGIDSKQLPPYDRMQLRSEMQLFDEWFLSGLLGLEISAAERELIDATFTLLEEAALSQTAVAVHRDYHSRNLMIPDPDRYAADAGPGIVDFQDAVRGAYSYDLVSLLRDCYIRWDEALVRQWAGYYREKAIAATVIPDMEMDQLQRDMDLMGLQRHLKVMGIFSRLFLRDKKSRYLADIPLVISYFLDVAAAYPELATFLDWFRTRVLPAASDKLQMEV